MLIFNNGKWVPTFLSNSETSTKDRLVYLNERPTSSTLTYQVLEQTYNFESGHLASVANQDSQTGFDVYLLQGIVDNKAIWTKLVPEHIEYEVDELVKEFSNKYNFDHLPNLCGQPSILFGAGTPQASIIPDNWISLADGGFEWVGKPVCIGQQYIDTTVESGGRYIGVRDENFNMKWVNS